MSAGLRLSRLRWSHVLLCLGLLFGQTAALAHTTHHELLAGHGGTPCEQCAMAHSLGSPPVVAILDLQRLPGVAIAAPPLRRPPARRTQQPNNRGPPTLA